MWGAVHTGGADHLQPARCDRALQRVTRGARGRARPGTGALAVALVAVPLALLAVAALSSKAWLVAGPAIGLCAMVPFTVDQDDLDARWINAFPALGVVLALCSTIAAARRAGRSFASAGGDPLRLVVAAVVVSLLPWVAAELGFHLPGDIFLGEEHYLEEDGRRFAAVHLGHHHGGDGAVLVLTALLLSRVRLRPEPAVGGNGVSRGDAGLRWR